MEEKINIAELLKDCPKGMELDCTMFDNVTFGGISNGRTIVVTRRTVNHKLYLDKYGCPLEHFKGDLKCVIFPKGKTTWEGFVPPCTFKDGDVVTDGAGWIGITLGGEKNQFIPTYCVVKPDGEFEAYLDKKDKWAFYRLATEEEKERLFKVIKEKGYKWNAETKTLEKLIEPKFKVGDIVQYITDSTDRRKIEEIDTLRNMYHTDSSSIMFEVEDDWKVVLNSENVRQKTDNVEPKFKDGDVLSYQHKCFKNRTIYIYMRHNKMNTTYYVALSGNSDSEFMINNQEGHALNGYNDTVRRATKEEKQKLFDAIKENGCRWNSETKTLEKLVEPTFKVGDRIKNKNSGICDKVIKIFKDCYLVESCLDEQATIGFDIQDNWELVPNKFDINTLVPFESRVLVRNTNDYMWKPAIYGFVNSDRYYIVGGGNWNQCIPYEGNQELMGTTKDCDDFYKTWEE